MTCPGINATVQMVRQPAFSCPVTDMNTPPFMSACHYIVHASLLPFVRPRDSVSALYAAMYARVTKVYANAKRRAIAPRCSTLF